MAGGLRKFGVLVLGVVAIVAGVLSYPFRPSTASSGWTAYAPLSDTTFTPVATSAILPGILVLVGAVLIAGWVGFAAGRRRP